MPSVSRTIYYLVKSDGFAEPLPNGLVVQMNPTVLIYKGVYRSQSQITPDGLAGGKLDLTHQPPHTLLRPVPSSDGPPYWSAIVYRKAGNMTVRVREELPASRNQDVLKNEDAVCYHADPPGDCYAWETDISSGRSGYFLTGGSGPNALWRITRIQVDALNRQVLTFGLYSLHQPLPSRRLKKQPLSFERFSRSTSRGFNRQLPVMLHLMP